MKMAYQDLVQQLRRQLVFLRNSVAAYDAGHLEEAIRIAVVIRVLCHDHTASRIPSISLLQHMDKKMSLQLVTTAKTVPSHVLETIDFAELMAGMTIGNTLSYDPVPDNAPTIACPEWWEGQTIFKYDNQQFTRKDLVLTAANKDGGAHVSLPNPKLEALRTGFWSKTETKADRTTTTELLVNNHFRMLRRLADELLSSRELLALAN
jgi:hypothetical protein